MCSRTDMPKITDTDQINTEATGSLKTRVLVVVLLTATTLSSNQPTEITIRTMDPQEIRL